MIIICMCTVLCYARTVAVGVKELRDDIVDHLSDARRGERIRNGLSVVIAGNTNVGKSSLLNHLCKYMFSRVILK